MSKFLFFRAHTGTGPGPWMLSQWWPSPFVVDGCRYATAEHWMMWSKAVLFGDLRATHPDAPHPERWPGTNLLGKALEEARRRLTAAT